MKAINYIAVLALLVLGSCTSGLYTGIEYDDLYFLPSDQKVARAAKPANTQIVEGNLKGQDYYDNIYAADTLVSDEYTDAVDFNQALADQNYGSNYYGFDSYSGRLSRFYGNYFNPYWRDPFYYSMGFPSMSYGFGRNPYSYDPFYDDYGYGFGYPYSYSGYGNPYSYYGGYNGGYYGGYYGSYFGGYSPFSNGGLYPNYSIREQNSSVRYGRREMQSTYSTRLNKNLTGQSSSRTEGYISKGSDANRRTASSNSTIAGDRRSLSNTASSKENVNPSAVKSQNASTSMSRSDVRSSTASRPEYNNVNRTYTPSYNNPRMSTRPSYNNSRTGSESVSSQREPSSYTPAARSSYNRNNSSVSTSQTRSSSSYSNPGSSYSSPSRSGVGNSYSSGSGSRSSSGNYSGGSNYSRSSSSGSSSSGSSGSSYSSGSSGGGGGGGDSRSGGGNSGSDSGGRR